MSQARNFGDAPVLGKNNRDDRRPPRTLELTARPPVAGGGRLRKGGADGLCELRVARSRGGSSVPELPPRHGTPRLVAAARAGAGAWCRGPALDAGDEPDDRDPNSHPSQGRAERRDENVQLARRRASRDPAADRAGEERWRFDEGNGKGRVRGNEDEDHSKG